MTEKEAIGRIQEHRRIHSKKEPFTPYLDEAFDMGIEALESLGGVCDTLAWYINERNRLLKEQRPHGEWKTEPHSRIIHCSNCGAEENINKIHSAKWCYSCGADMREGEANEKQSRNEV